MIEIVRTGATTILLSVHPSGRHANKQASISGLILRCDKPVAE